MPIFPIKKNLETDVINYLTAENNVAKSDIVSSKPFIANLEGNKNVMVSIKLKNDAKTYFYYKNDSGNIILESYTKDGSEHVIGK